MGLREKKKQLRRQAILDAADRLFHSRGYKKTRVSDIVTAANISQKTFFNYFPRKEAVLESLMVVWFQHNESIFSNWEVEVLSGTRAALPPHLDRRLELIERDRDLLQMVMRHTRLLFQASPNHPEIESAFKKNFEQRRQQVQLAQERGELRTDISAQEICQLYDGLRTTVVHSWLKDEGCKSGELRKLYHHAMQIFTQGLSPE